MSDKNMSLINFDGASDVAIKLLDMIQDAVGWAVSPHGSKVDFNEAVAIYKKSIEEESNLPGLVKAAKISTARKDLKKYINQGKIISYAIPDLNPNAKLNVEDDWLTYFFDYAQNISDESVQKIWARILAEQCNGDTSINRILIHTLSLLDANTAKAFGNLCKITFEYPQMDIYEKMGNKFISKYIPLVISPKIYGLYLAFPKETDEYNLTMDYVRCIPSPNEISVLEEIGLIELSEKRNVDFEYPYNFGLVHHDFSGENNSYKSSELKEYIITYDNNQYIIEANNVDKDEITNINSTSKLPETIKFGMIKYTTIGETLYKMLNIEKNESFEHILKFYVEMQDFKLKKR